MGDREAVPGQVHPAKDPIAERRMPEDDLKEIKEPGSARGPADTGETALTGESVEKARLTDVRATAHSDLGERRGRTVSEGGRREFEGSGGYPPAGAGLACRGHREAGDYTGGASPSTLMSMEVYGLTGGIGSGKSTVASVIEEYGIPVVSADELSRMVVTPGSKGLEEVVSAFGEEILTPEGHLDRAKLASIVFSDAGRREQLERILHPRIRSRFEEVLDALEKAGQRVVIYEVPLLFENNMQEALDGVIVVSARNDLRIARVGDRDGLSADETRARMAAQMDDATRQSLADYVVTNNGDRMDLRREVELLLQGHLKIKLPDRRRKSSPHVASGTIE